MTPTEPLMGVLCGDGVQVAMTNTELGQLAIAEHRVYRRWHDTRCGGPHPMVLYGMSWEVAGALARLRAGDPNPVTYLPRG